MVYSFARIGATLGMTVFTQNRRLWVWLREKGGKRHAMPCHHNLYKNNPPVNQARALRGRASRRVGCQRTVAIEFRCGAPL